MSAVRKSILFSALDKYVAQVLLLATTAVMARILSPAETGLYVLASSVLLLADNLRTFGVGVYIVQVPDLRQTTLRSAFTVTLLLSLAMVAAINLGAGAIAEFFGEAEVAHCLRLASLGLLVVPFATPIVALLQREFGFRALALLNIAAATTNSAVTIALGAAGFGPVCYVWGFLAASVVLALLAVAMRPEVGIFRPCLAEARQMVSFGVVTSSSMLVNMAYELLPRFALGRLLSLEAVGLYSRAVTLCQLPDRVIGSALQPVLLPAFAAQARNGGDLASSYLRGHMMMSAVQWPVLVMLALLADPAVRLLLGPQWTEAAPLVRTIALATMTLAPAFMTFPVLVAAGRVRDSLWSSLISLPPSILTVIWASTISLEAVAASMFVVAPLQMAVALAFVRRAIGLTCRELLAASGDSIALALGTALIPFAVLATTEDGLSLDLLQTSLAVIGGAAGWVLTVTALRHPIGHDLLAAWRMVSASGRFGRPDASPRGAE